MHVLGWQTTFRGLIADSSRRSDRRGTDDRVADLANRHSPPTVLLAERRLSTEGFVAGGPLLAPILAFHAELCTIYLRPEAQRHAVGRALVHALAAALVARGNSSTKNPQSRLLVNEPLPPDVPLAPTLLQRRTRRG